MNHQNSYIAVTLSWAIDEILIQNGIKIDLKEWMLPLMCDF